MRKAPCTAALIGTGQTALHGVHRHYYQYYDSSCMSCPVLVFLLCPLLQTTQTVKLLLSLFFSSILPKNECLSASAAVIRFLWFIDWELSYEIKQLVFSVINQSVYCWRNKKNHKHASHVTHTVHTVPCPPHSGMPMTQGNVLIVQGVTKQPNDNKNERKKTDKSKSERGRCMGIHQICITEGNHKILTYKTCHSLWISFPNSILTGTAVVL